MSIILALSLLCPRAIPPDSTVIAAGCRAPADGVLWTIEGDAQREGVVAGLRAESDACAVARDAARASWRAAAQDVASCQQRRAVEAERAAAELDACAADLDVAVERATALERESAARLPSWVWALAGAGAPMAALGVCALAECGTGARWGAAGGSVAVVAALGVAWEW